MRIGLSAASCVVVAIAVLVPLTTVTASASDGSAGGSTPSSVISVLTSVPVSATDAVGDGGSQVTAPQSLPGPLLTARGKPELLYIGAEYCPYCGTERWSMIVALSRFGTFGGLSEIRSSSTDVYPDTATWTFYRTTFTSKYITFEPVEMYSDTPAPNGGYTPLQALTPAQQALFVKYDAPPYVPYGDNESYPFVDFGNKYVIVGSSYDPGVLSGLSWARIAADLSKPSTQVARAVDGTANYVTAALCELTHEQPAAACTRVVRSLQPKI
jgi:hypothetical protein